MARSMKHSLFVGNLDGTPYVGIARSLVDDAGNSTRAKGGLWVKLEGDTDSVLASLTDAAQAALEFAAECESIHAKIIAAEDKPKAAPKATKAPKAPRPPKAQTAPTPSRKDNTRERLAEAAPKVTDAGQAEANRKIAIANARLAATPRVENPARNGKPQAAPKSDTFSAADWANLIEA